MYLNNPSDLWGSGSVNCTIGSIKINNNNSSRMFGNVPTPLIIEEERNVMGRIKDLIIDMENENEELKDTIHELDFEIEQLKEEVEFWRDKADGYKSDIELCFKPGLEDKSKEIATLKSDLVEYKHLQRKYVKLVELLEIVEE